MRQVVGEVIGAHLGRLLPAAAFGGPVGEPLEVLAHQALWTLALVGLGRYLLYRGTRRLVVQGG